MNAYRHDIGQWAADAARYTHLREAVDSGSIAPRRLSISSSTASDYSNSFSDVSQETSATSLITISSTSEQAIDSEFDLGTEGHSQDDANERWHAPLQNIDLIDDNDSSSESRITRDEKLADGVVILNLDSGREVLDSGCAYPRQTSSTSWPIDASNPARTTCRNSAQNRGSVWNHRSLLHESKSHTGACFRTRPSSGVGRTFPDCLRRQVGHVSQCQAGITPGRSITDPPLPRHVDSHQSSLPCKGPNPRRTSATRSWTKPSLVRQHERRQDFVMHLVGKSTNPTYISRAKANVFSLLKESATQLVAHIWPSSNASVVPSSQSTGNQVISLRFFIQETLRRSRSTYSTLQLTLYYLYLIKIKGCLPSHSSAEILSPDERPMCCGRRMFLAGLILASKYLQDRNYSTKAWSKITSLGVQEINANERKFLRAIDYNLHLNLEKYNDWCSKVSECVDATTLGRPCPWAYVLNAYTTSKTPPGSVSTPLVSIPVLSRSSSQLSSFSSNQGANAPEPASINEASPIRDARLEGSHMNHECSHTFSFLPEPTTAQPHAPTLGRNLSTPQISPWLANGNAPAASASLCDPSHGQSSHPGIPTINPCSQSDCAIARSAIPYITTKHQPTCRSSHRSRNSAVSARTTSLSSSGSCRAPQPAFTASMATSQLMTGSCRSFTNVAGFVASPMSMAGSVELSFNRSTSQVQSTSISSRFGAGSSDWTTTCCYTTPPVQLRPTHLPSPLRLSRTQLPTPPMSARTVPCSAVTHPLDTPITSVSERDGVGVGESDGEVDKGDALTTLCKRVALESRKHGLLSNSQFTLPPMRTPTLCENFDSESSVSMSSPVDLNQPEADTIVPPGPVPDRRSATNLPAIAHLLRCGLEQHLKPVVQGLHYQHAHHAPISHPAVVNGVKRCHADDDDVRPLSKFQRVAT